MIAEKRKVIKWSETPNLIQNYCIREEEEWIAVEINLKISIDGKELVRFACSPIDCEDLAIGFLFTEGIISGLEEIDHIIKNQSEHRIEFILSEKNKSIVKGWTESRTMSSGCGQGVISNLEYRRKNLKPVDFKVNTNVKTLPGLFKHLVNNSEWYDKTGCIHSVSLFFDNGNVIIREDIGRHNAVDKVIGCALQCKYQFHNSLLYSSGRISSDMMLKAARAQIPVVVSKTAPTSLAVDIAEESGITLIGFARGRRLNIYTHPEQVDFNDVQNEFFINEHLKEGELLKNK
jgi:FdhD protein